MAATKPAIVLIENCWLATTWYRAGIVTCTTNIMTNSKPAEAGCAFTIMSLNVRHPTAVMALITKMSHHHSDLPNETPFVMANGVTKRIMRPLPKTVTDPALRPLLLIKSGQLPNMMPDSTAFHNRLSILYSFQILAKTKD